MIEFALAIALGAWLLAISVVDARRLRIPDLLSLPLAAVGLMVAALRSPLPFADHLLGAGVGYLALALIGTAYFKLRGRDGLGLGDAKLLGAAGAWTGWAAIPFVLLLASCSGLVYALIRRGRAAADAPIAFGPHLAAGFWLAWVFGLSGVAPAEVLSTWRW